MDPVENCQRILGVLLRGHLEKLRSGNVEKVYSRRLTLGDLLGAPKKRPILFGNPNKLGGPPTL